MQLTKQTYSTEVKEEMISYLMGKTKSSRRVCVAALEYYDWQIGYVLPYMYTTNQFGKQ